MVIFGRSSIRDALRVGSETPLGSGEAVDPAAAKARLQALGDDGRVASELDRATDGVMASLHGLSNLTVPLALNYLDRIARPLAALDLPDAVRLTTRGYAGHLVIEERGRDFGVETLSVITDLPAMKRGAAPQGLSTRLVKITRRNFDVIRAVSEPTWDGLVTLNAARLHRARRKGADGRLPPALDVSVVDALLRFGWVLRQVDLFYGLSPDRT
jgi:hypothetical protein